MSTRNSPNLRRWGEEWGGALHMARRWKIECFEFATEGSYWTTIANVKRKRIPNSRVSYRKTSSAKTCTCTDTRYRQQIRVRWTQCTSWSVMFKNRVLVCHMTGDANSNNFRHISSMLATIHEIFKPQKNQSYLTPYTKFYILFFCKITTQKIFTHQGLP